MSLIFNSLGPIFAVVALGYILRRSNFLHVDFFKGMNKLTYYVGLPCLLFYKVAESQAAMGDALRISATLLATVVASILISLLIARPCGARGLSVGCMVQASFRGNLTYVGLPVIFYCFAGRPDAEILSQVAVLAIAPLIPLYNILSIIFLMTGHGPLTAQRWKSILGKTFTNPLLLGCVLGGIFVITKQPLPNVLLRTTTALGQMALPLALLAIGASLNRKAIKNSGLPALSATFIKIALSPTVAFFMAKAIGLSDTYMLVAIIFAATPTAVTSYVMAEQLGSDAELASTAVVWSTLLSGVSLTAILWLFL